MENGKRLQSAANTYDLRVFRVMFVLSFIIDLTLRLYLNVFLRCKNIYKAIDPSTKLKTKNEAISSRVHKLIHMGTIRWCHSQVEKPTPDARYSIYIWFMIFNIQI